MSKPTLKRSTTDRWLGGVCGGLAVWLGWNSDRVRIAYVLISILSVAFPGILAYLVLWILIPADDE